MKKFAFLFLIVGAVLVLVGIFAVRSRSMPTNDSVENASTAIVARRTIGKVVKATGVIRPCVGAEVRVGSRASGVVKRLHVKVGDFVENGRLLAELDDRDLVARRDQAEAELQRTIAELRYAQSDLQRKRELKSANVITPSEMELTERAAAVAEQQVAVSRASLAYASTQLEYAKITAPISGVVASVSTQEGETVSASLAAPTFVTLVDLSRLEIWAYVDETDIGRIKMGQDARFTVDTYADQEFEGRVSTIYPKAEIRDNVVDYVTVVNFEQPNDRVLRPDMTASVRIALDARENVVAVPIRAVRLENGRSFVFVDQNGSPNRRLVTTGTRDDSSWEIVDGLREGESVFIGEINLNGDSKP